MCVTFLYNNVRALLVPGTFSNTPVHFSPSNREAPFMARPLKFTFFPGFWELGGHPEIQRVDVVEAGLTQLLG